MYICPVCNLKRSCSPSLCLQCSKSHERNLRKDDGTILASIIWAAARARRFERKRHLKKDDVEIFIVEDPGPSSQRGREEEE